MDEPLLESVPNISVGRDVELVDAIVDETRAAAGAAVVDVHRDPDHDRSVLTIIGRADQLVASLEALARACVRELDLHGGHGVHPRVGVVDVVPVIALDATSKARTAAHGVVERVGASIGALGVPVVRYGLAASGEHVAGAASTGAVRRGGPGTVADRIAAGELERIAGPVAPHATAGVSICGVRDVLVAFNVDLDVDDLDIARTVAGRIRQRAEGEEALTGVRALGLRLASRGVAQVSTNVEQYRVVGPARVLESVARLAQELGAGIAAAELVGLAPDAAVVPLRYACARLGVPLLAAPDPSLDAAAARVAATPST